MQIKGKIIQVLEEKSGTGANGDWNIKSWVLETDDEYSKKIAFEAVNKDFSFEVGQDVTVSVNLESNEYNGRWYTSVKAWKIE